MRTLPAESFLPAGVGENCKKLQGKFLRIISSESPAKLYCCYAVIAILATSVIALSVALSDMTNWPSSQTFCMAQEAHLAQFDSLEELNFLIRYKGDSTHWIGLHRETSQNPWRWTDSTKYNNLVPIRGEGQYAYLSDRGISSGKEYMPRKWICSKPNSYLQCPVVSQLVSKQS
ncbi:C-type lectin domain family 2 member D11-like isoform X2 [Peromyscus leucopus]|uniref:C-type lectin domain family 2 member D11-like isoform X2 n=1 Tax=Peromyscus leucopus TaxID=10041 RepID=UPI0018850776|nr:C-type lectin domain family 2 member D11-like isoform X2 [Peromyscus leucopus]